jgi:hypothetical protein
MRIKYKFRNPNGCYSSTGASLQDVGRKAGDLCLVLYTLNKMEDKNK